MAEKNAPSSIENGMISQGFINQSYNFFRWRSRIHAIRNATPDMRAKIHPLPPLVIKSSLKVTARHNSPRETQIISIARIAFLFIDNVYCCAYIFDSPSGKTRIRFESGSHYYFVLTCDLYKPV